MPGTARVRVSNLTRMRAEFFFVGQLFFCLSDVGLVVTSSNRVFAADIF